MDATIVDSPWPGLLGLRTAGPRERGADGTLCPPMASRAAVKHYKRYLLKHESSPNFTAWLGTPEGREWLSESAPSNEEYEVEAWLAQWSGWLVGVGMLVLFMIAFGPAAPFQIAFAIILAPFEHPHATAWVIRISAGVLFVWSCHALVERFGEPGGTSVPAPASTPNRFGPGAINNYRDFGAHGDATTAEAQAIAENLTAISDQQTPKFKD